MWTRSCHHVIVICLSAAEDPGDCLQCGTHDPSRCIFCFRCYHCGPPEESFNTSSWVKKHKSDWKAVMMSVVHNSSWRRSHLLGSQRQKLHWTCRFLCREAIIIEAMGLVVATHHDKSVALLSSQQITVYLMGVLIQPVLSHPLHK